MTLGTVRGHDGVVAVGSEVNHFAWTHRCHRGHMGVGGIEHAITTGGHVLHDDTFDQGQVFHGVDVIHPEVVTSAEVGHHGHLAAVVTQTFAQDPAACGFKNGGVDIRVHQHIACTLGAAAIATVNLAAIDIDAVGQGHAHAQAAGSEQVGGQAGGCGFAVGAGHCNDGNAAILTGGKQVSNNGFTHRTAFSKGGRQVHAQARCGIDFHHAAALVFQRLEHGFADHVHAANVQAHHLRGSDSARGHVGVHIVGHIGGGAAGAQVGVVAQHDTLAFFRHALRVQALQGQTCQCDVVKTNLGQ